MNLRFDELLGFYNQNLDFLPQSKQTMTVSLPAGIIAKMSFNIANKGIAIMPPTNTLSNQEFPLTNTVRIINNKTINRMSALRDSLSFRIVCICMFFDPQ